MSDEADDFDPDANVPIWVNVVVPIVTVSIFVIVIVLLWRTDREIPVDKIKQWISKMPLLNKNLSASIEPLYNATETDNDCLQPGEKIKSSPRIDYGSLASRYE